MAGVQLSVAVLTCVLVLSIPGFLVSVSLRLRGLWLAATAPIVSFAVIGLTAMSASIVNIQWSIWPVVVAALVAAGIAWALTRILRVPPIGRRPTGWRWGTPIAVAAGVGLMTLRTIRAFPGPELFVQSFDNVFHLSAARFIVETGAASPWDISALLRPAGNLSFYPSGWHALVALVAQVADVPVTIASNACLIVVACVVWPVGVVLLTRTIFGNRTPLLVAAGALSAGFATYPFALISSMGTYPLVGSIALMPAALAGAVELCGLGSGFADRRCAALFLLISFAALGVVHPSAVIMLLILSLPLVILAAVQMTPYRPERRRLAALMVLLYAVLVVVAVLTLRSAFVQPDARRSTVAQALGEVILSAFGGKQIAILVASMALIGLIVAGRGRTVADWTAIGLWATASVLYVGIVAGDEFLRRLIGGPWFVDPARVAAFTPVVIIPLAALGATTCWSWLTRWVRSRSSGRPYLSIAVTATAIVLFAMLIILSQSTRSTDAGLRVVFAPTDNVFTSVVAVGSDERDLIRVIEQTVPVDEVIANNPRDGSGFIYPLTGRHLLTAYMLTSLDADRVAFYEGIADAEPSAPACEVARRLDVRWVVEFHPSQVPLGDTRFEGIKDIDSSVNVELVKRIGDSALYRIVGCGFGDR